MAAFIILAHKDPGQVGRLARRLMPHHILLHVDSAVSDAGFAQFRNAVADLPHVHLTARHRSAWGRWGIVEAMLEGIQTALTLSDWTHVMILSGQDYPIVSSSDIAAFFDAHAAFSFLPSFALPHDNWGQDGGMHRIRYWHRPIRQKRFYIPIPRRLPDGLRPAGGSMFNCLTRDMAMRLIAFTRERADVARFYRDSWIPEEMYIPTAVMHLASADEVSDEGLTYIRWSNPRSAHPDFLTAEDAPELIEAGRSGSDVGGWARRKLFARKINHSVNEELIRILDRDVHRHS